MTNSASNKTNFKTKIFRDERDDNPERKLKIWKNRRPNVKILDSQYIQDGTGCTQICVKYVD